MDTRVLELLERHGSLAYEQVAVNLDARADAVRNALAGIRDRGLIAVRQRRGAGGNLTNSAAYWRLTPNGRAALADARRS